MGPKRKAGRPTKTGERMTLVAFRLPADLIAGLDAYAERLQRGMSWPTVTRADALRALLTRALAEVDHAKKGS